MQRSLLPRGLPEVEGLEVGAVYESSARVEVGGDVYDFLSAARRRARGRARRRERARDRGDRGHGAREVRVPVARPAVSRTRPTLLAQANEVAFGELAGGNFVTMACLTVDPATGAVFAASAGHPPIRVLRRRRLDRPPRAAAVSRSASRRTRRTRRLDATLEPGAALCIFTDGLVEARRDGDQYGEERLHRALVDGRELSAQALAEHVVADARAFAGEPDDDYAVVVIRRT